MVGWRIFLVRQDQSTINISAVANRVDRHDSGAVVNREEDAIVADAQTIRLLSLEFLNSVGARI
jgi:hypothetical protein